MKKRILFTAFISLLLFAMLFATACTTAEESEAAAEEATTEEEVEAAAEEAEVEEAASEEVEPVTISYWHTMADAEAAQLELVIAAFEEANPGITVEATDYAYDDFKAALLTSIAGGEAPDTARLDIVWVPEFANEGALLPLDTAMSEFDDIAASVFPGTLETNYWDGHYYGLPQDTNTQVLLWNSELFEAAGLSEAPATMEELASVACQLSDPDNEVYGLALGGTYFWAPAPIFYAMGGKVVDDDLTTASGYVNSEESVAAFTTLVDLYNNGCLSPNLLGGGIGTSDGHGSGKYAMIFDGPWMVDIYASSYPDFEVNFALVPTSTDGTTSSVVGGEDVVVFADSENQEAAMKWTAYLMSEEAQIMMGQVGVMPTLTSLTGSDELPEYYEIFMEQLETAQARVPHPAWSDMDNAINNAFQRMLRGDQTVQESLDQAAEEINALLQ